MPVPVVYRSGGEYLTNYDWQDLADGNGYVTLYGATDQVSGGLLTKHAIYSDTVYTWDTTDLSGSYLLRLDKNFDTSINKPLTIKGKVIANIPAVAGGTKTSSPTIYGYVVATLQRVSGATTTNICTGTSTETIQSGATPAYNKQMVNIVMTAPLTTFKKGDTLRLNLKTYGYKTGTATVSYCVICHDPKNRMPANGIDGEWGSTATTTMTLNIPVVTE